MFSLYSKVISFCLLALGFNACDDNNGGGGDPVVEYGVPSAKYKVSGKVVSSEASKKPVAKIRVVMLPDITGNGDSYVRGDTVFTDTEGMFVINREDFPYNKYNIKLQDVDGETNGLFEDKLQKIEFTSSDYKDGGSWYRGLAEKDLGTIEITPKAK